jgi:drug/metabolite transporter (DMT)-like permease
MTPTAMNPVIRRQMGARQWLLLLILGTIWGASFFFNALALKGGLPPLTIVALRVAGGTTFLWAALLALGFGPPKGLRQWRDLLVLAVINNIVPFTLIIWGQRDIASGVAAILNGTVPFFTIIVAHLFTRDEPIASKQLAGVAVALGGIGCMVGLDAIAGLGRNVIGEFAVLGAALCYGFAGVWGRRLAHHPPLVTSASQTLVSSAVMLPLALLVDGTAPLAAASASTLLVAILGLGLLCTAVAYVLFFEILRSSGAGNVSLVTLIVPVNATLLGTLVLGEPLLLRHIVGIAAVALGLALIDGRLARRLFPARF